MGHQLITITQDKPLLTDHKLLLDNYLVHETTFNLVDRNKIMALYDLHISPDNIRLYYNRKIDLFLRALLFNRLSEIKNYYHENES